MLLLSQQARLVDLEVLFGPQLDQYQPDLVHVHDFHLLGVAARYKWRRGRKGHDVRIIYDAHEYIRSYDSTGEPGGRAALSLEQRYVRAVDRVITVSPMIASWLVRDYGLDRSRVDVLLNTPSTEAARMGRPIQSVRESLGLAANVPLIVYSGMMSAARGIEDLVAAVGMLNGVHLVLVAGDGDPFAAAQLDAASEGGFQDRVHVVPYVSPEFVTRYLSGCDVAVHPLRRTVAKATGGEAPILNHEAALPNKLFDYLHAGLPVVVSDCRVMSDFVREHGVGLVFKSGNVEDLARALTEAIARREELSARITPDLLSTYSWESGIEIMEAVYRGVWPERQLAIDRPRALTQLSNLAASSSAETFRVGQPAQ